MKVFISWSGEASKAIGEAIRKWIPGVLQSVKPYFSPDDIAKGTRWGSEIAKELEESRLGLIVLTPENTEAPWLMFEAGALAKNLDKSKVCPLLFGLDATDIKGPLAQFQSARFGKDEMKRVVKMINAELGETGLALEVLDRVFNMWWPDLESSIGKLPIAEASEAENGRTDRDIIEEILELSRAIASDNRSTRDEIKNEIMDAIQTQLKPKPIARIKRSNLCLGECSTDIANQIKDRLISENYLPEVEIKKEKNKHYHISIKALSVDDQQKVLNVSRLVLPSSKLI